MLIFGSVLLFADDKNIIEGFQFPGESLDIENFLNLSPDYDYFTNSIGSSYPVSLNSPNRLLKFKFNGITLNNTFNNQFDISAFQLPAYLNQTDRTENSIRGFGLSDCNNTEIFSMSDSSKSMNRISIQGGNKFGSTYIFNNGKYDKFFWNFLAGYYISNGYDALNNDNQNFSDFSSKFEMKKISIVPTLGINDTKTQIYLSYFFQSDKRTYADSMHLFFPFKLKNYENSTNLITAKINTKFDYDVEFTGNLFYKSSRTELTNKTYDLDFYDYRKFDEKQFGSIFTAKLNSDLPNPVFIQLEYVRKSLNLVRLNTPNVDSYEFEEMLLDVNHSFILDSSNHLNYKIGLSLINPLFSEFSKKQNSDLYFNSQIKLISQLTKFISAGSEVCINNDHASFQQLFPQIIDTLISKYEFKKQNISFGIFSRLKYDDLIDVTLAYNYENFKDNIPLYIERLNYENAEGNNQSFKIDMKLDLYLFKLNIAGTYFIQNEGFIKSQNYIIKYPDYFAKLSLFDIYKTGTYWQFQFNYFGDYKYYNFMENNNFNLVMNSFPELNFVLSQDFYENFTIFFKLNNILNVERKKIPDIQMPGINFTVGVMIKI